jgi:hypothetical protein
MCFRIFRSDRWARFMGLLLSNTFPLSVGQLFSKTCILKCLRLSVFFIAYVERA